MNAILNLMVPGTYYVRNKQRELRDTFTLSLEPSEGAPAPVIVPGQFNMLYVFGVGEVPISLSGDPDRTDQLLVHTIRAVGAVTEAMGKLKPGDALGVRGPFGSHWPLAEAIGDDLVIIAGGLGLAPLRPAVYHLLAHRPDYERVVLIYGARSPDEVLYRRELDRWRKRPDLDIEITVDKASPTWRGNVGVVTALIESISFDSSRTTALLCGPEVMMRFAVKELQKCGVKSDKIFLSLERNMKCALGFCGRCQFGPTFICKDGPILRYDRISPWFEQREI